MSAYSVMIAALAGLFAFLTALPFASIAGWVEGSTPGLGYLILAAAAALGASFVLVPEKLVRHR